MATTSSNNLYSAVRPHTLQSHMPHHDHGASTHAAHTHTPISHTPLSHTLHIRTCCRLTPGLHAARTRTLQSHMPHHDHGAPKHAAPDHGASKPAARTNTMPIHTRCTYTRCPYTHAQAARTHTLRPHTLLHHDNGASKHAVNNTLLQAYSLLARAHCSYTRCSHTCHT